MTRRRVAPAASAGGHVPVLMPEVLTALTPKDNGIYVDGTFGAGGYSKAILDAAECRVYGFDRDPDALAEGDALAAAYAGRLTLIDGPFGEMDRRLAGMDITEADGVALDLGVSSMQLDRAERGFSFRQDGPLDMRMARSGPSATDVVNTTDEQPLADIIYRYGEERMARRIARAIVAARKERPISTTAELAAIVRGAMPPPRGKSGKTIDAATRTFQAIRVYVNDEIAELRRGLESAERLLRAGGRLAVVTFHSLEDREVKTFLADRAGRHDRGSRHLPETPLDTRQPTFRLIGRGVTKPSADEIAANPRARSAKLRVAERLDAPAWEAAP